MQRGVVRLKRFWFQRFRCDLASNILIVMGLWVVYSRVCRVEPLYARDKATTTIDSSRIACGKLQTRWIIIRQLFIIPALPRSLGNQLALQHPDPYNLSQARDNPPVNSDARLSLITRIISPATFHPKLQNRSLHDV